MPLALRGTLVEGLELRVAGGEIVEARARRGADTLRAELAIDDGARHFGELALVDASSRVGETGIVFHNTLFDENAARTSPGGAPSPGRSTTSRPTSTRPRAQRLATTRTSWSAGRRSRSTAWRRGGAAVALLRGGLWQL